MKVFLTISYFICSNVGVTDYLQKDDRSLEFFCCSWYPFNPFIRGLERLNTFVRNLPGGCICSLHLARYSQLKNISTQQTEVPTQQLEGLAQILVRHNVQNRFGIYLIHSHVKLDKGPIMLRTPVPKHSGYRTRQVDISKFDLHDIHGNVFALRNNGPFVAYDYGAGPASDMSAVGPKLLCDVIQYLTSNKLEGLLGLKSWAVLRREALSLILEITWARSRWEHPTVSSRSCIELRPGWLKKGKAISDAETKRFV